MTVCEEQPPFPAAESDAPPSEQQITTPSELEGTSPGEPQITPLVIPSSPEENNKKRTNIRHADPWPMSFCHSPPVRQHFLFLRVGKSPRIRRRNPLRNSRQSTRCGTTRTGRLPAPTSSSSARFRRQWLTNYTLAARSTPTIIGPIRALFSFIVTSVARCAEPVFGIPNKSLHSARALGINLPLGSRSEISPKRTALLPSNLQSTL
jgi:hypothetical protein